MLSSRQQAYLDAMDIGVWNLRKAASNDTDSEVVASRFLLKLGPGSGGVLLICARDSDSDGRLANDINRALGLSPVWAWPDDSDEGVDLAHAVEENLFTTVAFFGAEMASQIFEGELPANQNSAKLVLLPSMQDIQNQAGARRALWTTLCKSGLVPTTCEP